MTARPVVAVVGLGRCGTSLVMQMLAAGGMAVAGEHPAFEDPRTLRPIQTLTARRRWGGRAVKLLQPYSTWWPDHPADLFVLLTRDLDEQARSQAKLLRLTTSYRFPSHAELRASLAADEAELRRRLPADRTCRLPFEEILRVPSAAACKLNAFLQVGLSLAQLDVAAMAGVVRKRSSTCAPRLDLELELMREEAAHG